MKNYKGFVLFLFFAAFYFSCTTNTSSTDTPLVEFNVDIKDSSINYSDTATLIEPTTFKKPEGSPTEVVAFAKTLVGIPYLYGSTDPLQGFDCSGFITYVFNHFEIEVPRSSIDFTNVGTEVKIPEAITGDLILFTGTDTLENFVGHMGIITENTDSLRFIHATSGKKYGVTITALNSHYLKRFVKVIRIF